MRESISIVRLTNEMVELITERLPFSMNFTKFWVFSEFELLKIGKSTFIKQIKFNT